MDLSTAFRTLETVFRIPERLHVPRWTPRRTLRHVGIEGMPEPVGFDTTRRFVRVVQRRPDGFVEFRFSIGEPSLFVEMFLSEAAFAEFCSLNHAELLDPVVHSETEDEPDGDHEVDDWDWTLRDAAHRRFR